MCSIHACRVLYSLSMSVDRCKTPTNLDAIRSGESVDTDSQESKFQELVSLFRTLLESYLDEFCSAESFKLLPPVNGDGKSIDLFNLFLNVNDKGGFDAVSQTDSWGEVAQESELGFNNSEYVKLTYIKYLSSLARWLNRDIAGDRDGTNMDLTGISDDLRGRLEGFLVEVKKIYELSKGEASKELGAELKWFLSKTKRKHDKSQIGEESGSNDAVKEIQRSEMTEKRLEKMMIQECSSPGKRKRDPLPTLQWLNEVAKKPCDPSTLGPFPDRSTWESYGNEDIRKQLLLFRASRTNSGSACKKNWQKIRYMHPSLYNDSAGTSYNLRERRILDGSQSNEKKSGKGTTSSGNGSLSQRRKRATCSLVGPEFQAEVPEWTDITSESDTKLLGTHIWSPSTEQNNNIGKGREEACYCQNPGSVECIRSHITTKQEKLKLELGSAFYIWRFDNMGESSLQYWSDLEAKKIKCVMSLPPTLSPEFFDQINRILSSKSRTQILNYFYNVTLLQFRANQNRVSPDEIDSDTDYLEVDEDPNPEEANRQ